MFESWKVGQTGWVRLRNGKVARAVQFGHDSRPVQIQFMKESILTWMWVDNSGNSCLGSETNAISHLPDCTGFDWEEPPKPHQWKVGDWFVVDRSHRDDDRVSWHALMDRHIGMPQEVKQMRYGFLMTDVWTWHPSWCRPCDPPKAKPTRFQHHIEYVGIHDAI